MTITMAITATATLNDKESRLIDDLSRCYLKCDARKSTCPDPYACTDNECTEWCMIVWYDYWVCRAMCEDYYIGV